MDMSIDYENILALRRVKHFTFLPDLFATARIQQATAHNRVERHIGGKRGEDA
jgi:hypothetical protein